MSREAGGVSWEEGDVSWEEGGVSWEARTLSWEKGGPRPAGRIPGGPKAPNRDWSARRRRRARGSGPSPAARRAGGDGRQRRTGEQAGVDLETGVRASWRGMLWGDGKRRAGGAREAGPVGRLSCSCSCSIRSGTRGESATATRTEGGASR